MVKKCAHGLCNSDSRYTHRPSMQGVFFIPFPNKRLRLSDCEKWVKACNRVNFTVSSVKKHSYICSKHFVGGRGPTQNHPHPFLATGPQEEPFTLSRTRKRLLPTEENVSNEKIQVTEILVDEHGDVLDTPAERNVISEAIPCEAVYRLEPSTNEYILPEKDPDRYETFTTIIKIEPPAQMTGMEQSFPLATQILTRAVVTVGLDYGWAISYSNNENSLVFMKLRNEVPTMSLYLNTEKRLRLKINGEDLSESQPLFSELSSTTISNAADLVTVLKSIGRITACEGFSDKEYLSLYFVSSVPIKDCKLNYQTLSLHSYNCQQITPSNRKSCPKCSILKHRLRATYQRRQQPLKLKSNSKCNLRYLPISQIQEKMKLQKNQLRTTTLKLERLRSKVKKMIECPEETTTDDDGQYFEILIENNSSNS